MRRKRKLNSYDWDAILGDRTNRYQYNPADDLPSDDYEVQSSPTKTAERLEFERSPESVLRGPKQYFADDDHLEPDCPRCPVDWRWQRVCVQVHRHYARTLVSSTDPWIDCGQRYLEGLLDCRDDAARADLARREPDVHDAYTHYRSSDKLLRGRLEAYLLGHQPFGEIAVACNLSTAAVEAYECLFFDVRSRLQHPLMIHKIAFDGRACGIELGGHLAEDDVDLILKRAGFHHGGVILERMIQYFSSDWGALEEVSIPPRSSLVGLRNMLSMRKIILLWLVPPQMERARLIDNLESDLGRLLAAWPEGAAAPNGSPYGSAHITAAQLAAWWTSWRKVVDLARRTPEKLREDP